MLLQVLLQLLVVQAPTTVAYCPHPLVAAANVRIVIATRATSRTPHVRASGRTLVPLFSSENDGDEEEDEICQKAYGNRSLAWTNRYRKLLPYEASRRRAMDLGLSSKEEWDDYRETYGTSGGFGPYLISRPDEMYVDDWISWDEFLGVMRSYSDAQQIVRNVLQFRRKQEYVSFVKEDPQRAAGLRIPAKPDIVYKHNGWQGWDVFLGTAKTPISDDARDSKPLE